MDESPRGQHVSRCSRPSWRVSLLQRWGRLPVLACSGLSSYVDAMPASRFFIQGTEDGLSSLERVQTGMQAGCQVISQSVWRMSSSVLVAGLVDLHAGNGSCTPFRQRNRARISRASTVRDLDKRELFKIEIATCG